MKSKFETMLEHLVNEDKKGAEKLFHEIVVQKSRQIYESLLEDDLENEDEFGMGGDPSGDLEGDIDSEEMGDDEFGDEEMGDEELGDEGMGDEEELEDRVVDLEDALDDLKSEFERLMSDDDDEMGDEEFGDEEGESEFGDEEGESEFGDEEGEGESEFDDEEGEEPDELKDSIEMMREYVEKVSNPTPGDNGQNTKSVVANKNDMGGKTDNIAKNSEAKGSAKKVSPKVDDAGNRNKPGAKASKQQRATSPKMGPSDSEKSMLGSKKRNNG